MTRESHGTSLDVLLRDAARRLAGAGVTTPRVDAELLLAHVLEASSGPVGRGELQAMALRGAVLPAPDVERFTGLVDRRSRREPLQHLTGTAAFRGLELSVGPGVFVPRPETEVLAGLAVDETAVRARELAAHGGGEPVVVDLCTGSGAIALAVATEVASARVVAVEVDPAAVVWARRNVGAAPRHVRARLDLRLGDAVGAARGVLADLAPPSGPGVVDVVASNPPYIPDGARPLEPEVADHDPRAALFGGGEDGLDVPRGVVATAAALLRPGGLLLMEHADVQGRATRALVDGPGWDAVRTVQDLTGRDRVLVARRTGAPPSLARRNAGQ